MYLKDPGLVSVLLILKNWVIADLQKAETSEKIFLLGLRDRMENQNYNIGPLEVYIRSTPMSNPCNNLLWFIQLSLYTQSIFT